MAREPLDGTELDDLQERWRGWFLDSEIRQVSRESLVNRLEGEGPPEGLALTEAEAEEAAEFAFGTVFDAPRHEVSPLIGDIVNVIKERVPDLEEAAASTPVLVLPTLEYQAFAHTLQSGRPYVALSLSMIWQPSLTAALALMALEAINEGKIREANEALNGLTVMAWHLKTQNHELLAPYAKGRYADRAMTKQAMHMARGMTAFVVLHEFAHIHLRHQPTRDPVQVRRQEFEADALATKWWHEALSPREHWDYPIFGLAVHFRLHALADLLGEKEPAGYPTWTERLLEVAERLAEVEVPLDYLTFGELTLAAATLRALKTTVISKDTKGKLQAYGHSVGTLNAVTGVASGTSDYILLMLAPDQTVHERVITPEEFQAFRNNA